MKCKKNSLFKWIGFILVLYWYIKPTIFHVLVEVIDSISLVFNIWYCGIKRGVGQEKLHWPELLWYDKIIVDHINKRRRCSGQGGGVYHIYYDARYGLSGILNHEIT